VNWFYARPHREQIALLVAAGAVLLYALVFGVVNTLQVKLAQQHQQTDASSKSLQRVKAMAGEIAALEQSSDKTVGAPVNLAQLIDRTLRENQLQMSGFQPGREGDVRLRLEDARFTDVLQWLYDLEHTHNVRVLELSILPNPAPGQVSVQLQLLALPG
jgi:general secretion pathway protein M